MYDVDHRGTDSENGELADAGPFSIPWAWLGVCLRTYPAREIQSLNQRNKEEEDVNGVDRDQFIQKAQGAAIPAEFKSTVKGAFNLLVAS